MNRCLWAQRCIKSQWWRNWPFSWIIIQVEKKRRVMLFQFSCASRDGRGYWGRWYLWRWWWWCWRSTWMIVTRGDLNFKLLAYTLDPCFGHLRESWKNYFLLKSVALSSWFITAPKCHWAQFWVRWGPNGDHRQHKWGPKKRIFENLSERANYLQFHVQVFEYLSTKLNSTDMLAWY